MSLLYEETPLMCLPDMYLHVPCYMCISCLAHIEIRRRLIALTLPAQTRRRGCPHQAKAETTLSVSLSFCERNILSHHLTMTSTQRAIHSDFKQEEKHVSIMSHQQALREWSGNHPPTVRRSTSSGVRGNIILHEAEASQPQSSVY